MEFKITLGVSLKILLYEPKIEITPFSHSFGKAYASADYGDFGWGECPHVKYRLTLKAGKAGAGATVKIQSNDSDTSSLYTETTLDADGNSTVYLPGREYRIIADKGSMEFVKTIKLSRGITVDIDLEQGSTGGNPGTTDPDTPDPDKPDPDNPDPDPTPPSETIVASGTCGDNLTWKLDDEGTLTISGKGAMTEWVNSDSAPWKTYSNTINKVVIQPGVTSIGGHAFSKCKNLTSITIPEGVTSIGEYAFYACDGLIDVTYHSTMERWEKISIESNNYYLLNATIHCTDGDIVPNTENSITTGTASTSDSKFQAAFAEAKAGKEYVVLVSRSGSDPLNADNLIYINQITADADGELTVPFITAADAAEMTYVVACAQDDATVEPGQPDKPNQPDQPGGDQPSSGDDGGGAAIILIGGVAGGSWCGADDAGQGGRHCEAGRPAGGKCYRAGAEERQCGSTDHHGRKRPLYRQGKARRLYPACAVDGRQRPACCAHGGLQGTQRKPERGGISCA